jgi:hypothetical protein
MRYKKFNKYFSLIKYKNKKTEKMVFDIFTDTLHREAVFVKIVETL